jgi:FAD/FMN-containing dehydrogenase
MILAASSVDELRAGLDRVRRAGERVSGFRIDGLQAVRHYTPEDLTVTVEAGLTLGRLQERLAERGQFLPLDPPRAERLSIGAMLAGNWSGPRRFGFGPLREHVLGIEVMLADGRLITAGGRVVKNVAGYDLCKLFVGSRGSLGVITAATFKVQPLPEREEFVAAAAATASAAAALVDAVRRSELRPVALEIHNVFEPEPGGVPNRDLPSGFEVVIGVAGTRDEVEWQLTGARALGFAAPGSLGHERRFWELPGIAQRRSILPARLADLLAALDGEMLVGRAGNGVVWYRGAPAPTAASAPEELLRRVKQAYDPSGLLPSFC